MLSEADNARGSSASIIVAASLEEEHSGSDR
jgi:hypothetical protein